MIERWRLTCGLATVLLGVAAVRAADPAGRAGTWEVGAGAGASFLDAGFDSRLLGYTVPSRRGFSIPVVQPDNLDSMVPTLGLHVGYSLKPWVSLEFNTASGSTGVGSESVITPTPDLEQDFTRRQIDLKQQEQTVPGIYRALDQIEYEVMTSSIVTQFHIRNRPEERFVFYFSVGAGFASLNANTSEFNDCPQASDVPVIIADDPALAGDQNGNGLVESPEQVDIFQFDTQGPGVDIIENPEHIDSFVIDCGRMFPMARLVTNSPDPEVFWIGKAEFSAGVASPGNLLRTGQQAVDTINGLDLWTYVAGGGMRWYLKPRHLLRFDARRHFGESINKEINEFTVAYGYVMGQGRAAGPAVPGGEEPPADPSAPAPPPDPSAPPPDPSARAGATPGVAAPTYSLVSGR